MSESDNSVNEEINNENEMNDKIKINVQESLSVEKEWKVNPENALSRSTSNGKIMVQTRSLKTSKTEKLEVEEEKAPTPKVESEEEKSDDIVIEDEGEIDDITNTIMKYYESSVP